MTTPPPTTAVTLRYPPGDVRPDLTYPISEIPLKTGGRRDVTVHAQRPTSSDRTGGFLPQLRSIMGAIQAEAERYAADPYTNVQALAKLEVILADVRSVHGIVKRLVADALHKQKIRRLTVEHVVTVEASSEGATREWNDRKLLDHILSNTGLLFLDRDTGEVITGDVLAADLLRYFSVSWRLTPLREDGYDEERYSTIKRDDPEGDETVGKVARIPTVKIIDNAEKRA